MVRYTHTPKLLIAALALFLASCGGSQLTPPSASVSAPTPHTQTGQAQVTLLIPARSTNAKAQYVSAGTQSVTLSMGGKVIGEADVTSNAPICTKKTGEGRECSVDFSAPVGNDAFVITLYDAAGGKGHELSTGNLVATIQAGGVANVPVTLDGIPASVTASLSPQTLPVGDPGRADVIVQVKDASGNTIVGPGNYTTPVKLQINADPYQTLALSTTTVTSPSQAPPTLSYAGGTNIGSTIVPSLGRLDGTPATFTATGGALTMMQFAVPSQNLLGIPEDVAAFSDGTAAITFDVQLCRGAPCAHLYDAIGIADHTIGVRKVFAGDTIDPYNVPTPGSIGSPDATTVNGMSENLTTFEDGAFDDLATDDSGHVYYTGFFNSPNDPSCAAGQSQSGTIGILDTHDATTTETVLKGFPGPIKRDRSGNVWWVEDTGFCSTGAGTTYYLGSPDEYAIGKLSATTHTVSETTFVQAGLTGLGRPTDLSVSPDGAYLYIVDASNIVARIPTSLSGPSSIALTNSAQPADIATADDGTTMWWSYMTSAGRPYYGYVPGSKAFATANLQEALFPFDNFPNVSALAYGEGSFWAAGDNTIGAIGRVSGLNTSTPVVQSYVPPIDTVSGLSQTIVSVSEADGYVWATDFADDNIDIMQFGAPIAGVPSQLLAKRRGVFMRPAKQSLTIKSHERAHHSSP